VRDEIKEKNKLLPDNNKIKKENNEDSDVDEETDDEDADDEDEREFNLEERLRIERLEEKRLGLQEITFERMKEEMYNGKQFFS
jgi:hypothetical protein